MSNGKTIPDQSAKADFGKLELTQVPTEIIRAIARVRMYGTEKYGDRDNWKRVEAERYRDAMYRHWLAYLDDPYGLDAESGLPHLHHAATNIAFLCDLEKDKYGSKDNSNISPVAAYQPWDIRMDKGE